MGDPTIGRDQPVAPTAAARASLLARASALALVTIYYNIVEGVVSVFFGLEDETLALFGFGLDSFVEVGSGIGIWHLVRRISRDGGENPDRFEVAALKTTGGGFYVLGSGLAITAALGWYQGRRPETTFWGIVVSVVSIASMWFLARAKTRVGSRLNSPALLADAACTRTCLQLSLVLLAASAGYALTGIGGLDAIGTLVIAALSLREGREAFGKARAKTFACACGKACQTPPAGEPPRVL